MGIFFKPKGNRKLTESSNKLNSTINKKNYKNYLVKAISLIKGDSDTRESLTAPEYDLEEIKNASEADSYIKMSVIKYSYMFFKAGYKLKSENEDAAKYVRTRFYIMSFTTGKPVDILFQEIGDDLIKYSNAFIVKSRVKQIMSGINAKGFFKDDPVGGYFRIDPSTIAVQRNENGDIKKYVQFVDGKEKAYDPTEVIHFYLDKDAANAFGTPRMIAALEDVKVLRRIEGNVLALIHRFSMPLFQWIIGLPQTGFQATDNEIEDARREIERMPLDGSVVTNEKTSIKAIGAEGSALNAKDYLEYFEKRVFSALGVSESQMGRGSTGSNADTMESQAHDTIKHIQQVFSSFIENYVINELLLEGGFNPILNEDDRVSFVFNEISLDTRIKLENHEMNKYQSNMITFDEMRREIGKKEDVDENRLYQKMIIDNSAKELSEVKTQESIEIAQAQGEVNIKTAKATAGLNNNQTGSGSNSSSNSSSSKSNSASGSKGVNPKGNGTEKDSKPNKSISNANTPENQHGKTSVKITEKVEELALINKNKEKHKKVFSSIYKKYDNLCNDIKDNPEDIELLMQLSLSNILEDIKINMQMYSLKAINNATDDIEKLQNKKLILPSTTISLSIFEDEAKETLQKILKDIMKRIGDDYNKDHITDVFNAFEYRMRFMLEYILPKIYWYSYLKTGLSFKYKRAYIDFGKSEDKDKYNQTIDLNSINIETIPPFHSFCSCKITFKKGVKK